MIVARQTRQWAHRLYGAASAQSEIYAAPVVCGLLLLAVALVFGKTVRYDFINFDDDLLVYDNPMVTHGVTARASSGRLLRTCPTCGIRSP